MLEGTRRSNRHSNPSQYAKKHRSGRLRFIRHKRREVRELSKGLV